MTGTGSGRVLFDHVRQELRAPAGRCLALDDLTFSVEPGEVSVDEAVSLGNRILVFARPGRVVETVAVPAGLDEGGRAVVRAQVVKAPVAARLTAEPR